MAKTLAFLASSAMVAAANDTYLTPINQARCLAGADYVAWDTTVTAKAQEFANFVKNSAEATDPANRPSAPSLTSDVTGQKYFAFAQNQITLTAADAAPCEGQTDVGVCSLNAWKASATGDVCSSSVLTLEDGDDGPTPFSQYIGLVHKSAKKVGCASATGSMTIADTTTHFAVFACALTADEGCTSWTGHDAIQEFMAGACNANSTTPCGDDGLQCAKCPVGGNRTADACTAGDFAPAESGDSDNATSKSMIAALIPLVWRLK